MKLTLFLANFLVYIYIEGERDQHDNVKFSLNLTEMCKLKIKKFQKVISLIQYSLQINKLLKSIFK